MKSITKALYQRIKDELYYLVCLVLLLSAWMGVASMFYKMITKGITQLWMERIYNILNNNVLLNIPVCICLIYIDIKCSKRVLPDKSTCFRHVLLIIFTFLLLYYKSPFVYANVIWNLDYREFLLLLFVCHECVRWTKRMPKTSRYFYLFVVFGLLLSHYLSSAEYKNVDQVLDYRGLIILLLICFTLLIISSASLFLPINYRENLYAYGFSPDYNRNIEYSESLRKYAESIVSRLLLTDLGKESFAVGITSEWGAGKTTFLRLLKMIIGKKADVVEFNPWMCRTPEQLTNDFFSSLDHQLSKRYNSLSRPIKKYARYLNAISFPASNILSIDISNIVSEESLYERKKKLSKKFLELNNPIIVIIDDIDRLEREEVFEVLRLIRNTADLCNVIYLVAYDKEYVTSVLNEKRNIKDASIYMEKIFQIEIQLPMVTDESIWKTLLNELKTQLHDNKIELEFNSEEQQLILSILSTYRRAKRFARLFSLNYSYLKGRTSLLEWRDVFWLDMLQMHNKTIYNNLCYDRKKLLDLEGNHWIYRPAKTNDIDGKTYEILMRLWGENEDLPSNAYSIRNTESFNKYFTLQFQLSNEEIDKLVAANDFDAFEKISEEKGVEFNYLWNIIKHNFETNHFDNEQKKSFLNVVLTICYHDNEFNIGKILKSFKDGYTDIPESELYALIHEWLSKKLNNSGNRIILSAIIGEISESCLLEQDDVLQLIQAIIQDYIDKEGISAYDLIKYDSNINMIIRYLYLRSSECKYDGQKRRQDAFKYIINTLPDKGKMTNLEGFFQKTYEKALNNTFIKLYDENWERNMKIFKDKFVDL